MSVQTQTRSSTRWQRFCEDTSLLRVYLQKYRKYIGVGLLSLVVVDILEVLPPFFLKEAIDVVVEKKPLNLLFQIAMAYLAVAFVQGLGRYGWRMFLIRASLFSGRDLRSRFSHHLYGLAASFFDRRPIGELMSLATSDVEAVRMTLGSGLLIMADALFYFMTIPVAMFFLSPQLTLLAFIPMPIIPWLVWRNEKEIHERFEKVQEGYSRLSAFAQEGLNGIRVTKAFAKEGVQNRRFREVGEEFVKLNMKLARVQNSFGPTLDFTMSLGLVLLLFVAGKDMIQGGAPGTSVITLGTFVAFQRYIQKMVWPMAALGMAIGYYQRSLSSSKRLKEIFSIESDVKDPRVQGLKTQNERALAPFLSRPIRGKIQFKDLSFKYQGSSSWVLRNIRLEIEAGERVAFMGSIGGGKSTLLSLIPRLYPVEREKIEIDNIDINDWPLTLLRGQIGFVSQEVFLFSDTIENNIAYGAPERREKETESELIHRDEYGGAVSFNEIMDLTALACVHEDIMGLPNAYSTKVGERGVTLSGGQKQRISISRALLKNPAILILDDSLSSVDVRTEMKILTSLNRRRQSVDRKTELISAHRISTIQDSDRIVVLEKGEVIQLGNHRELIQQRSGRYRLYYEQQRLKEEMEY